MSGIAIAAGVALCAVGVAGVLYTGYRDMARARRERVADVVLVMETKAAWAGISDEAVAELYRDARTSMDDFDAALYVIDQINEELRLRSRYSGGLS